MEEETTTEEEERVGTGEAAEATTTGAVDATVTEVAIGSIRVAGATVVGGVTSIANCSLSFSPPFASSFFLSTLGVPFQILSNNSSSAVCAVVCAAARGESDEGRIAEESGEGKRGPVRT